MTPASELRSKAREALKGNWKFAVGAGFIALLLGVDNLGYYIIEAIDYIELFQSNHNLGAFFPPVNPSLYPYYVFGIICYIVVTIISGMTVIGYSRLNLDFVDGKALSLRQVVSEYPRILRGLAMILLTALYTLLWTLLFIIPGIIASLAYALTPYLMAENPDMGANEAITLSKKMMKGNKESLFYLYLTFIGWSFSRKSMLYAEYDTNYRCLEGNQTIRQNIPYSGEVQIIYTYLVDPEVTTYQYVGFLGGFYRTLPYGGVGSIYIGAGLALNN